MGVMDAIVESYLLFLVLAATVGFMTGAKGAGPAVVIFGTFLGLEKLMTVYHSNHFIKEYIPKDKVMKPLVSPIVKLVKGSL